MSGELVRVQQVEVIEPEQQMQGRRGGLPFAAIFEAGFARAHQAEHWLLLSRWIEMRNEWLEAKTRISGSASTRRTYASALDCFWMWLGANPLLLVDERRRLGYMQALAGRQVLEGEYREPWTVSAAEAMGFRLWLEEEHSAATTAHYMAVASSFYQYVVERTEMTAQGVEVSLFVDARGSARTNPFRNRAVSRPKVRPYNKARPVSRGDAQRFFDAIKEEPRPLVRARDMALFRAYLMTGRRATEIVTLRWGDIEEMGDGQWEFRYIGKGKGRGRGEDASYERQALPAEVYWGIVGYLRLDGRWPHIGRDEYIFRPISDGGVGNFRNVDAGALAENRHIAARRVGQLMDKICERAGIEKHHPHELRHTFAHYLYEATRDIVLVKNLLGHENVSTTQIYIGQMESKGDNYSQALVNQLGLRF